MANGAITTAKIGDSQVTTAKIGDAQVTDVKIVGMAYSKLTGAPSSLPPSGAASGDLSGTYPAPTIAANAITTTKIADAQVTDVKIVGMAYSKLTGAPSSLPPSGAASGDLTGTYPAPTLVASGVTAGTYGDLGMSANVTVDAKGRVTSISTTYRMQKQKYTNESISIPDNYTWIVANLQFLGTTSINIQGSGRLKVI